MIAAWNKEDYSTARVDPVTILILIRAYKLCGDFNQDRAVIDCIWMAFCFLLIPGGYLNVSGDVKHPFQMADVELKFGGIHIFGAHLATLEQISYAKIVSLNFTEQ